jgi:hypothetical protein
MTQYKLYKVTQPELPYVLPTEEIVGLFSPTLNGFTAAKMVADEQHAFNRAYNVQFQVRLGKDAQVLYLGQTKELGGIAVATGEPQPESD